VYNPQEIQRCSHERVVPSNDRSEEGYQEGIEKLKGRDIVKGREMVKDKVAQESVRMEMSNPGSTQPSLAHVKD